MMRLNSNEVLTGAGIALAGLALGSALLRAEDEPRSTAQAVGSSSMHDHPLPLQSARRSQGLMSSFAIGCGDFVIGSLRTNRSCAQPE